MRRFIARLFLFLALQWPGAAFAGTWAVNFVPQADQNASGTQCWGVASAVWTPTVGGDASGILNAFTVTLTMDAKNATMQTQFLNLCRATWTQQQQAVQGTNSSQLSTLITSGTSALNGSAQH